MAQNGEIKAKRRGPGRPIKKGEVLNPGGRPKIPEDVREMCRAASSRAIQELLHVFEDEQARPGDKIRAAEALLNRAWGTPTQSMELSSAEGKALEILIKYADKPE
ncbi:MAG: hypothetical protein WC481_07695 [Candidatus Omnitrophota bacterium]